MTALTDEQARLIRLGEAVERRRASMRPKSSLSRDHELEWWELEWWELFDVIYAEAERGETKAAIPDDRPHSRACGFPPHFHGIQCHTNCPTCHGINEPK